MKIEDIGMDTSGVQIVGEIVNVPDPTELKKTGKFLYQFDVYDGTNSITCKVFATPEQKGEVGKRLKPETFVKVGGRAGYDNFAKEITILANTILETEPVKKEARKDTCNVKRVELHAHTQMSQMDGIVNAADLLKRAQKWGMNAIAITDHAGCQSFPDAHHYMEKIGYDSDFKVLYGIEANLALDQESSVFGSRGQKLDDITYCVLDLETTGFSYRTEKITEIGIMKVKNGEVIEEFDELSSVPIFIG